jgi:hypothetical protein
MNDFRWPIIMIGLGGLLLAVPTNLLSHFKFYGWGSKEFIIKLGCNFIFCMIIYSIVLEMLICGLIMSNDNHMSYHKFENICLSFDNCHKLIIF